MKIVNVRTDASVSAVPIAVNFQAAPGDKFSHLEQVYIQLVNNDGDKVGKPGVRSVVMINSGDDHNLPWYEAFIPAQK
ncbi:hypothetical protein AAFN85_02915 [Mucilaginibacter sp. CAU 1740]|uniref:hypothetical protein n=1 Tax=Mucilaginibacter sp. CAU 1740 TaxID=3140365 RepID=UPI00325A74B6